MLNVPQTLEQARKYKYGQVIGKLSGKLYVEGRCAYEAYDNSLSIFRQCSRPDRYGPSHLYCKQHAKMIR